MFAMFAIVQTDWSLVRHAEEWLVVLEPCRGILPGDFGDILLVSLPSRPGGVADRRGNTLAAERGGGDGGCRIGLRREE